MNVSKTESAPERFAIALHRHATEFGVDPGPSAIKRLREYYQLLDKWNPRLHLIAPCSPQEFATRHVLESLMLLRHLPDGARLADVGSGGGLPIIPCLIARDDLSATLIEPSKKKGVFLKEALRVAGAGERSRLVAARFEETSPPQADFVTCRALDNFAQVLTLLIDWAPRGSSLLLFVGTNLKEQIEKILPKIDAELIPLSQQRYLVIAQAG